MEKLYLLLFFITILDKYKISLITNRELKKPNHGLGFYSAASFDSNSLSSCAN